MKIRKLIGLLNILPLATAIVLVGCSKIENSEKSGEKKLVLESYENGELYLIGFKISDQKVGEWRLFRKGRLFSISNYHEGILHGKEISYEPCTGKVLEEGYYDMGKRIGLWYFYNNGELVAVREFKNDIPKIVYHNPKFKYEGPPPPPNEHFDHDCEDSWDY